MTALRRWLPSVPILVWGRAYNQESFTHDLVAALIVTVMLIPQSLAYALLAGLPPEVIATRFHVAVSRMIAEVCARLRAAGAGGTVGLTGGVFQNALLLQMTIDELHQAGFEVLVHQRVPANDGGLALGQAVLARSG